MIHHGNEAIELPAKQRSMQAACHFHDQGEPTIAEGSRCVINTPAMNGFCISSMSDLFADPVPLARIDIQMMMCRKWWLLVTRSTAYSKAREHWKHGKPPFAGRQR